MATFYTVKTRGIGLPDYAQAKPVGSVPVGPIYTSTDMGELAARLKSSDVFDRRGNIVWFDDFEDGVQKWTVVGDAGFGYAWDADHPHHSGHSLKFWTGAGAWWETYVSTWCPYPTLSKMGFEVAFRPDTELGALHFYTQMNDGTVQHRADIAYNLVTDRWTYLNAAGGYTFLPADIIIPVDHYSIIKVVCDFETDEYVRLIVNNATFNLGGIGIRATPSVVGPYLGATVNIVNQALGASTCYMDSAIITQNESDNPIA